MIKLMLNIDHNIAFFIISIPRLDLTTFLFYLSKITTNLPENYLSKSKTVLAEKSYSSKK